MAGSLVFQSCGNGGNEDNSKDSTTNTMPGTAQTVVAPLDKDGEKFATEFAYGNQKEIAMGKWGKGHAVMGSLKDFSDMIVQDHTTIYADLKTITDNKHFAIPDSINTDTRKHMTSMMAIKPQDFDKHYTNMMLDNHKKNIHAFEKASKNLEDSALRQFAIDKLPTLRKHYDTIKAIKDKM